MSESEGNVHGIFEDAKTQAEALERLFKSKGGGGNDGGMDQRIERLEKAVERLQLDVGDIRVDLATIKENVRHLPTKPWMFTTLAATVTILITVMTFVMGAIVRFMPHAN